MKNHWVWTSMAAYATSALRAWNECKNPSSVYADDAGGWFVGDGSEGGIPLDWVSGCKRAYDATWQAGFEFAQFVVANADRVHETMLNEIANKEYIQRFKQRRKLIVPRDVIIDYPFEFCYISLVGFVQACVNAWHDLRSWDKPPGGELVAVGDNMWAHSPHDDFDGIGIPMHEIIGAQSLDDVRHKAIGIYANFMKSELEIRYISRALAERHKQEGDDNASNSN